MIRFETLTLAPTKNSWEQPGYIRGPDVSVNPTAVVSMRQLSSGVVITLVNGQEWQVPGTLAEIEARLR